MIYKYLIFVIPISGCSPENNKNVNVENGHSTYTNSYLRNPVRSLKSRATFPVTHRHDRMCRAAESVLFGCRIGKRWLAVCGGTNASGLPYAQYRIGYPRQIELEYPNVNDGSPPLRWARTGYSGGGELQYIFNIKHSEHIVYSRVIRTGFDRKHRPIHKFESGVVVRKEGAIESWKFVMENYCINGGY